MADSRISGNAGLRAAEAVRAKRAAEKASATPAAQTTITTSQVRARLNAIPDETTLAAAISRALTALSRGVRWARGSIINLIV